MDHPSPTTFHPSTSIRTVLGLATGVLLLGACDPGEAAKTVQDKVEQAVQSAEAGGDSKAAQGEVQAAAASADTQECLSEFGYVWNEQRGRCMDPQGACNQGFTLNASTESCDVNQKAVCALPAEDPLHGLCKAGVAAPAKVEAQTCLSKFGYVWNEQWGRCMDPQGACNQGFTLNASTHNCEVNQEVVCSLPAEDPLHGLCKAAADEPVKVDTNEECLSEFGYVWNDKWGRCMDAQGACNQGFTLDASTNNCDVNQAAVCALPESDPLHGLCKGDPAEPNEVDVKGCLTHFGYVWNDSWGRCMDPQGACNQGFTLDAAKGKCEVNQTVVCSLPESDPLRGLCDTQAAGGVDAGAAQPAQPATVYATPKVHSEPVSMVVENTTDETLVIWWHNFDKVAENRTSLEPGGSFSQATFVAHVWTANRADGEEVSHYVPAHGGALTWVIGETHAADEHGCLSNFGYVWNEARGRCMDAQGACNQGFLLNPEASKCEVYPAVVCGLPESDPLRGLCES